MKLLKTIVFTFCSLYVFSINAQDFARGADVSWLSEMESSGKVFYNDAGIQEDLLVILQEHCINSIRLRIWVDPTGGWSGKDDVVMMAKRAYSMGFRIMIDFHYSDSWADPGKQNIPAAWKNFSLNEMTQAVYEHTYAVLDTLKKVGVRPEWVQIGNETNDGMLWDMGRASTNMSNYAQFVTSGNNAAHTVFPDIITIVHVSNGYDNSLFRWNIGGLLDNNAKFDAIGMSLYPEPNDWQDLTTQCLSNMEDMISKYKKPVLLSEVGMSWTSAAESKAFLEDISTKNSSLPNHMGLGVFWWEPETYNWKGYDKGAWGTDGKPTIALDGFMLNCNVVTGNKPVIATVGKVFPNPFKNSFQVQSATKFRYALFTPLGEEVAKGLCDGSCKIGIQLKKGVYLLKIYRDASVEVVSVVKE